MQRLYYLSSTKQMDELNKRLMLGLETVTAMSGASSPVVTCEVQRLTEKEMSEVHRIKVVGEININRDTNKKYVYLPDLYKNMLGGEYDARMVALDTFEMVESGLTISKRYCEFVEPKSNNENKPGMVA